MYDFKSAQKIEEKLHESNLEKLRLPLLSQEAIYCVQIDHTEFEEEARKAVNLETQQIASQLGFT